VLFRTLYRSILTYNIVLNRRSGRSMHTHYGPGEGVIWMDNVQCVGSETDLASCEHNGWGQHNCRHYEDVSISCGIGKKSLSCHHCRDMCYSCYCNPTRTLEVLKRSVYIIIWVNHGSETLNILNRHDANVAAKRAIIVRNNLFQQQRHHTVCYSCLRAYPSRSCKSFG